MSDVILFSNVRLSFPHLIEPQRTVSPKTGKERISYSADFIMPPDHAGFRQFMELVSAMAAQKWKDHAAQVMGMINADRKLRCFGDGNQKISQQTFKVYDGYENHVYVTAGRDSPPQIIQSDGSAIDSSNTMAYQMLTRAMYGGCRVNVAIRPWLQENEHGRGIRSDLVAIQFAGDDKPFGEGVVDASKLFSAVATQQAAPAVAGAMPLPPFMMG